MKRKLLMALLVIVCSFCMTLALSACGLGGCISCSVQCGSCSDDTNPGGGDNTNPGGDNTNPGGGDNTNPGGDNTNPGGGDNTNPGGGDNTNPGGGDNTNPGGGDNTNPGGGDNTNPGGGDNTNPGGGDNTNPGGGGNTNPGGDNTNPGGGDNTNPGGGDNTNPGGGDNTNPGGGDNTNPGGGDNTNPGGGDNTNPGGGDNTNPGGDNPNNPDRDDHAKYGHVVGGKTLAEWAAQYPDFVRESGEFANDGSPWYFVQIDHEFNGKEKLFLDNFNDFATCEHRGTGFFYCEVCSLPIAVLTQRGHNFINHSEKAATCIEPGYQGGQICTDCGYLFNAQEIPPLGHYIKDAIPHVIIDGNYCIDGGLITYTCPRNGCGEIIDELTEIIKARGYHAHITFTEEYTYEWMMSTLVWEPAIGGTIDGYCKDCGEVETYNLPAYGASLATIKADFDKDEKCDATQWVVDSKYSCDRGGYETYTIHIYGQDLEVVKTIVGGGHMVGGKTLAEWAAQYPDFVRESGEFANDGSPWYLVQIDHEFNVKEKLFLDIGNDFTCERTGTGYFECEVCSFYIVVLTQRGHNFVYNNVKPTCTQDGYQGGRICTYCGYLIEGTILPALDHHWQQTYSYDDTYHYKKCSRCTEITEKEKHEFNQSDICKVCGFENITYSEGLQFTLNSDGLSYSVTGIGSVKEANIKIPALYKDLPVTAIGDDAFYKCESLTSITIPDSVTSIGWYAFENCYSLTSITFSENSQLASIGYGAFDSCTSLTSITIPDSVTSIGAQAFLNCTSLKSITIPDSVTEIGGYAFYNCTSLVSITIPNGVTSIGYEAFYNCASLKSITIPDSVTEIGGYAFYNCRSLTSITIPDSVTSINDYAFDHCESLESITIPDGVTSIGNYAFECCWSLTNVTIGNDVTFIGWQAFYNCTSLVSVTIPDSVTSIGNKAFAWCFSLTSIAIGNDVTYIGEYAFNKCISLANVYWNATNCSSVDINYPIFNQCTALSTVTIGDQVQTIPNSLFEDCTTITKVICNENCKLTFIGNEAFRGCRSLVSITIPDSVTSIGDSAFYGCTSLVSITIPDSVTSIGSYAFYNCTSLESVIFENTTGWGTFSTSIASSDLADPATAAKYLTDTYYSGDWKRS